MKLGLTILAATTMLTMSNLTPASDLDTAVYGKMDDGREVKIFTLTNPKGMTAQVTEYGAILVSLKVPDRKGISADVTLGYDTLAGWLKGMMARAGSSSPWGPETMATFSAPAG